MTRAVWLPGLGQHGEMPGGPRHLLRGGCFAVSRDRPVVQVEDHRQEHLSAGHAVLADRRAVGDR